MTLSDLTRDAWTTQPNWNWHLPRHDRNALVMAREAGRIVTVQVRGTDGFELRARVVG